MKVNTDGVLLGAWADVREAKNVLDIGTGTGVIALMLAQKNRNAQIDALEIDEKASEEARFNAENSVFSARISVFNVSLQDFLFEKKYDVITSNPPYFVDDLKPDNDKRLTAKHTASLSYDELILYTEKGLSETGKFFAVIPVFNVEKLRQKAAKSGFFLTKICRVKARTTKPFYIALLCFERIESILEESEITIQHLDNTFSKEYIALTRDFYLRMED